MNTRITKLFQGPISSFGLCIVFNIYCTWLTYKTLLDGIELASTEQIRLLELEREDLDLREELEQLQETTRHWIAQLTFFSRPLQIITGLLGVVVGLLIFTSLFMDKLVTIINFTTNELKFLENGRMLWFEQYI